MGNYSTPSPGTNNNVEPGRPTRDCGRRRRNMHHSEVDENPDYDNLDIVSRDAEERYFDDDDDDDDKEEGGEVEEEEEEEDEEMQ
ncbi:hypothetical protein COCON_G00235440 [Conger conger]|uniref:CCD97-like C-terminal domain-containing protein n=1 Tax=Conger conger TaxID=82655 RepID=A0A9Q1HL99_CONCO|nr:hypothetical protein COCON_G00235440 [Conger conger]